MNAETRTRYKARVATCEADVDAAQSLRYLAFQPKKREASRRDVDAFDRECHHFLIEDRVSNSLVATFRVLPLSSGFDIEHSYSAQFYDLSALRNFREPVMELGRFCVAPGQSDPEILRVAWGALTTQVDQFGAALIFGCSSFKGTDFAPYEQVFALLKDRYLAPSRFLPSVKAPNVLEFAHHDRAGPDRAEALRTMPPLLRSYLSMGGWVSDHAVIDHEMNTLHVFTGLEVNRIPPARARVLRAVAG